ncbi:MAG: hypothetical protein U0572_14015 [Phycisphaerales bacterium]
MLVLSAGSVASAEVTIRVRQWTPTSPPNGADWSTAYPTIEAALAVVPGGGGERYVIKVGASSVSPYQPYLPPPAAQSQLRTYLIEKRNVWLKGGFPFAGGDARDIEANRTVLSGDVLQNDTEGISSSYADNAYFVMTLRGDTALFVLDGAVVEHGDTGTHIPDGDPTYPLPPPFGGGAIFATEDASGKMSEPIIQNCTIEHNFGNVGGAVAAARTPISGETSEDLPVLDVRTSTIRLNHSRGNGGGIAVRNSGLTMEGSLVVDNDAIGFGGGIEAERATIPPGALRVSLVNCTIANNVTPTDSAGGIYIDNIIDRHDVFLMNTICAQNPCGQDGVFNTFGTQIFINGNQNTPWINYSALPEVTATQYGEANIPVIFPLFLDASNPDRAARDYRLLPCSPGRDSGQSVGAYMPIDTYDADDDGDVEELLPDVLRTARVRESDGYAAYLAADMGAYEHDQASECAPDLNDDGVVNAADLAVLLGMWGPCPADHAPPASPCQCADIVHDAQIDGQEMGLLLGAWGPCPAADQAMFTTIEQDALTEVGISPTDVAWLFGFDSLEEFGAWLGEAPSAVQQAIIQLLGGVS